MAAVVKTEQKQQLRGGQKRRTPEASLLAANVEHDDIRSATDVHAYPDVNVRT